MHGDLILSNPNRIEKARKQVAIEKRTKELEDYIDKNINTISKQIYDLWDSFENSCLAMGKHYPALSPFEIENLSAWKYYRLYSYISTENKPTAKTNGTEEN